MQKSLCHDEGDATRQIERNFEKAFRDIQLNPERGIDYAKLNDLGELGLQYSVGKLSNGDSYVILDNKRLREDGSQMSKREIYDSLIGQKFILDGEEVEIVKDITNKDMIDELFRKYPKFEDQDLTRSQRDELNNNINNSFDDIIKESKLKNPFISNNEHIRYGITDFSRRTIPVYDGNGARLFDFAIAKLNDGRNVAYSKSFLSSIDQELTERIRENEKQVGHSTPASSNSTLSNDDRNVNRQYSQD
ncbi:MAG: hypothetical protein IKF18_01215 [Erysipelotrichaceae bacterium]|nr:hypothetical protein [Erysipelotrichaceae bacterium]